MNIHPIAGELYRVHVDSRSDPAKPPYLVDLADYEGNGKCACEQFDMRLRIDLEHGIEPPLRCHHIEAARSWWVKTYGPLLLDLCIKQQQQGNQSNHQPG